MTTITITLSGSAIAGLTGTPSKTYTLSDTDLQSIINWAQVAFNHKLPQAPAVPTPSQILLAWIQGTLVDPTINGVQAFGVQTTVPPPVSVT